MAENPPFVRRRILPGPGASSSGPARFVLVLAIAAALVCAPYSAAAQGPELSARFSVLPDNALPGRGTAPAPPGAEREYSCAQWGAVLGIGLGVAATYLLEKDVEENMIPGLSLIYTVPAGMLVGAGIGYIIDHSSGPVRGDRRF